VALAVTHIKSGGALAGLGRTDDAFADYSRALVILEPLKSAQPVNLSAVYGLVDAYFALGDLSKKLASRSGATSAEQRKHWTEARKQYQESSDASRELPNPGAVSPEGFTYHRTVAREIKACDTALRNLTMQ
jgi:hypothetical protein